MTRLSLRPALRHAAHGQRAVAVEAAEPEALTFTTALDGELVANLITGTPAAYHVDWGDGNEEDVAGEKMGVEWIVLLQHVYSGVPCDVVVTGAMTAVTWITFAEQGLTAIDVSQCPFLHALEVPTNQLTALDLNANPELTYLECGANPMTALVLGAAASALSEVYAYSLSLDSATVDAVLVALAANSLSDGTVTLNVSAIPGAAGLAAKATLEGRGWSVTVTAEPEW